MKEGLHPFFPIHEVLLELERRWRQGQMEQTLPFAQLCDRRSGKLDSLLRWNDEDIPIGLDSCHYTTAYIGWYKNIASAVACCLAAKAPSEKPLRNLLLEAMEFCRAADEIQATLARRKEDMYVARVRGGTNRHVKQQPAWEEAARLLVAKRPPQGWPNPTAAAKAIIDDLMAFIHAGRIPVITGDNLVRTIARWIRHRPSVTAAFKGTAA